MGIILVVWAEDGLRALDFLDYESRMRRLLLRYWGESELIRDNAPDFLRVPLAAYFRGEFEAVREIPVVTRGTDFQQRVWAELRAIPPGVTASYGELAARIGKPNAVRAVGAANGANPVAIVVPCHRVVGADGSMTGYGGGIERKRWLLAHEGGGKRQLNFSVNSS